MLEKIRETIQYETIRFGPPESFSGAKVIRKLLDFLSLF